MKKLRKKSAPATMHVANPRKNNAPDSRINAAALNKWPVIIPIAPAAIKVQAM